MKVGGLIRAEIGEASIAAPSSSHQPEVEIPDVQHLVPYPPHPQASSLSSMPQLDCIVSVIADMNDRISQLSNLMYANKNQVQAHLTGIGFQLDSIQEFRLSLLLCHS